MRIRCLSTGGRLYCPGEERLAGNSLNPRLPAGTIPQMHWALSQAPPQSSPLRATGTAQQLNGALLKGKSLSSHSSTQTHFTLITVSNSETLRNHIMPNWNPWCIPSRQREVLLTPASPSSTTHILHWKHLQSWRAYRVSTSQNPLLKHYRIQPSLLALNNPKCLLAQITGVQPHCGSQAFLRQVSSLVARMAQNKGKSWQRGHGRACAAPSLASPRSLGHCRTAKSPCQGPPQPLPHSLQRFISALPLQLLLPCARATCIYRWANDRKTLIWLKTQTELEKRC